MKFNKKYYLSLPERNPNKVCLYDYLEIFSKGYYDSDNKHWGKIYIIGGIFTKDKTRNEVIAGYCDILIFENYISDKSTIHIETPTKSNIFLYSIKDNKTGYNPKYKFAIDEYSVKSCNIRIKIVNIDNPIPYP